ncbi:penicillin-binding transpeptidase domain-containing protein [Pseudohongiella spirulinae]|uniref:Beta-lactamase n=1 Tax=Pseudohongiella spirulinae TaxID=1249552 RepID=A0A0S2KGU3_9GAMM|nr:penicillin-binding transpeptidase domain-containing protein [Pseudohongiella spirulinae]ALO47537.1 beta-lactamase [Pseudohongiella spirulinae]
MKRVFAALLMLCTTLVDADDWQDSPAVAALFRAQNISGTFVVYDVSANQMIGFDHHRANLRYPPAATFNLPHTLIGLSTGSVSDLDDSRSLDISLREALISHDPDAYQTLARLIGPIQMQWHLSALIYGNREFGSVLDTFWHDGPLQISAIEQVRFLSLLSRDALPFSREILSDVRELVLQEQGDDWRLYAISGIDEASGTGVGWWVGWLTRGEQLYTFALNLDVNNESDITQQVQLGRKSLTAMGLLELK